MKEINKDKDPFATRYYKIITGTIKKEERIASIILNKKK
jgi:hypothetical protein